MESLFDITIIGAGPVGLFAGFYAGLRQTKVKIIDSLEEVGGQPRYLYPEKFIYDIPGHSKINGEELANELMKQVNQFEHNLCLGQEVIEIHYQTESSIYQIITNKETHYSKTIIIAAGNGAFSPKKLNLQDTEKYENRSLHYYVKPLEYYANKKVAICGGGDSAVDWALAIQDKAEAVYLIHRRDNFRALESSLQKLKESNVTILTPYIIDSLEGTNDQIQSLHLKKPRDEEWIDINVDDVIISYGFTSSMGPIRKWGLNFEKNGIVVDQQLQTNLPGIYAIGDIASYPGKIKLIATGFGEAPMAVNNALQYIKPNDTTAHVHSSDLF